MNTSHFRSPVATLALVALLSSPGVFAANAALTGDISSAREGKMEGVVVSAQKAGSPITVSVISDAKGRYEFPRERLEDGDYAVRIRAIGYDTAKPVSAKVTTGKPTRLNIRLVATRDLAAQLSSAEWMDSVPGESRDKRALLNCVNCHTLERVMRSKYSAEEFTTIVLPRMQSYVNQSMPGAPQIRKGERQMEERGDQRVQIYKELGGYLASINLHNRSTWSYELKKFPRPTGEATRAIYTEYDLPRKIIQPHDVVVDKKGMIWYSSFG
jgi:hypothetical protein